MILGLGSDLIDIRRIEKTIERHGERFLSREKVPAGRWWLRLEARDGKHVWRSEEALQ